MKLSVLDEADDEASIAATYYENRRAGLGFDFLAELQDVFRSIEANPRQFALFESDRVTGEVRFAILDRFPYVVVHQINDHEAVVLAVAHMKRRPAYWRRRIR